MKDYSKTKEEWEAIGVLELTPEDRKDKLVHALNIAVKWLIDFPTNTDAPSDYVETIVPSIIIKIINEVDATDEEVINICKEFNSNHKIFDADREFARNFCHLKIKQLNSGGSIINEPNETTELSLRGCEKFLHRFLSTQPQMRFINVPEYKLLTEANRVLDELILKGNHSQNQ